MFRGIKIIFLFGLISLTKIYAKDFILKSNDLLLNRFIENKGQFDYANKNDKAVLYAVDHGGLRIFFYKEGISYHFFDAHKNYQRKKGQKGVPRLLTKFEEVNIKWLNLSNNVEVVAVDKTLDYHTYMIDKGNGNYEHVEKAAAFKKIIYKNAYPGIDIEYEFHPKGGLKYSFKISPGADPSIISMQYDLNHKPYIDSNGNLQIKTFLGNIIDHAPFTFYKDNEKNTIPSKFIINENIVSFKLGLYNKNNAIVIDPWTLTPSNFLNSNKIWEIETDPNNNVIVYGGDSPMQLRKYNAAGVLLWTYNTPWDTSNYWVGTMKVDLAGNSYITSGTRGSIQKILPNGIMDWQSINNGPIPEIEFWNLTFNCDYTKLYCGGMRASNGINISTYRGTVFELSMTNGNIVNYIDVGYNTGGSTPKIKEVRSVTYSPNGNLYYITLDSIGALDALFNQQFHIVSGFDFAYGIPDYGVTNQGIHAIAADTNFIYTHNGNTLQKRNAFNGAIIASVTIPGGINNSVPFLGGRTPGNSGIAIDSCGNIYVGSSNAVYKFSPNLTQLGFFTTPAAVYDVAINHNGEVVACGNNFIISDASLANCLPLPISCVTCLNISPVSPVCSNAAAFNLSANIPGGTWSGTGITNSSTGTFDPSIAGPGTHLITYTLNPAPQCGIDTISITVYNCTPLSLCLETNGDLTVSGGSAPYSWFEWQNGGSTPITNQAQCLACDPNYTWVGFPLNQCLNGVTPVTSCVTPPGYVQFASGTTITPTTNFPIKVVSTNGDSIVINSLTGIPPCTTTTCSTAVVSVNINNHVSCFGGNDGAATASATGGTAPYTFTWQPGNLSGPSQNSLSAGTYTVYVMHSGNCIDSTTVTITQPSSPLSATITTFNNTSCTSNTGSATVSVSGGTSPYTYSWSPSGGTGATANNLGVGTYTVTVTDNNGCQDTATVNITTLNGPVISNSTQTNVTCFGLSDGSISISVSGGTTPYTYSWSPSGGNASSATGLAAGSYTVTVTDNAGCSATQTYTITEPSELVATASTITPADCGVNNGAASITVTGGTGSYTYSWSPSGGSASSASGLAAGSYLVTVTDQNGCQDTANVIITSIGGPTINVDILNNVTCNGGNDGNVTISASGATPPYTYQWSPSGGNSTTANNLSAGTYTVMVTDANGCISTANITIDEPLPIVSNATITASDCAAKNGAISLNPSGGTGPYTYLWSPLGSTSSSIFNIEGGNYSITITDANNCIYTESFTVPVTGGLNVDITPTTATIIQGDSIQIVANGQSNYTYTWSPVFGLSCTNCPNPFASPNATTVYYVTVADGSGCTGVDSILIKVDIKCGEVFFPTIFSPNGDGLNDLQCVLGNCISAIEWAVYNRWGEKVFETTDPKECWDGTYKGEPMNTGVYVYKLKAVLINGEIVEQQGNITITR